MLDSWSNKAVPGSSFSVSLPALSATTIDVH